MPDPLTADEKAAGLQTLLLARALPARALDALEARLSAWQSFAQQEGMTHDATMTGAMRITEKAVMDDLLDWANRHHRRPPGTDMEVKEMLLRYQRYRLGLDVNVSADGVVTMGGEE